MATADPGSGPVSLFGVSDKLQSKLNSFREVIERKKSAVRRISKEMKSLIEKKEEEMIRKLDTIWLGVCARMEKKKMENQKEIEEIKSKAREHETFLGKLNQKSEQNIDVFQTSVTAKIEMDIDIPNVKLTWRVDELKDCIDMFYCEQQILVYNEDTRYQLKWSKCEEEKRDNQLYQPWGIATNPINENIYVADQWNHRVQIFSREGEWIRSVKDNEMNAPQNIIFHNQSIYVQCGIRAIYKFNDSMEKKEKSKFYHFGLRGICADDNDIYVGRSNKLDLIVLTLDLLEYNRISLKTEFCQQETEISDISLSQELFYILLFNTEFPIQAFSRGGILTRCVVKKDSISYAACFCLDQQHNIFVADNGDSKVKIFSNEGKLLTQFGERGSEKGQFSELVGLSLSELGDIFTIQQGYSPLLKTFSNL